MQIISLTWARAAAMTAAGSWLWERRRKYGKQPKVLQENICNIYKRKGHHLDVLSFFLLFLSNYRLNAGSPPDASAPKSHMASLHPSVSV